MLYPICSTYQDFLLVKCLVLLTHLDFAYQMSILQTHLDFSYQIYGPIDQFESRLQKYLIPLSHWDISC